MVYCSVRKVGFIGIGPSGQLCLRSMAGARLSEVLMSDAWFYDAGKYGGVGPLTLRELQDRLATVSNPMDVLVWRAGFRDWKLAKDVPELTAQIVAAPSLPRESRPASGKSPKDSSRDGAVRKVHRILFVLGTLVAVVAAVFAGSLVLLREEADNSVRRENTEDDRGKATGWASQAELNSAKESGFSDPIAWRTKLQSDAARPAPVSPPVQSPQFVYSPWVKFCSKGQDAQAKQVCITRRDARTEAGQPVIAAALIESEGEPKKLFRVTVPNQLQLQSGTRVVVDQLPAVPGPFFACYTDGCMADYEATPGLIGKLKHGQTLTIQAINLAGATMNFLLPLADFAKVNEGPPIDPKAFEEQQKKLQDEMQERIKEAPNKPEGQAGAFSGSLRPTLPIR
jgi:invasion protein IalB